VGRRGRGRALIKQFALNCVCPQVAPSAYSEPKKSSNTKACEKRLQQPKLGKRDKQAELMESLCWGLKPSLLSFSLLFEGVRVQTNQIG